MNKPLLSIITINYNNAEGLKKTMQSVLDLEFKDYEYIIIDGGSSDNSVNVIKDFLENTELKDKITFWCSEKDKGIYNAMNKGLTHVNGTLVNMMNSGDCFISDSLDKLPDFFENNGEAIFYGASKCVKDGNFEKTFGPKPSVLELSGICHQTALIPYSLHMKFGKYNENYHYCADYEFFVKCYTNNVKFVFLDKIICEYDLSGVSQNSKKVLKEVYAIRNKYFPKSIKTKILKSIKHIIKNILPYGIVKALGRV